MTIAAHSHSARWLSLLSMLVCGGLLLSGSIGCGTSESTVEAEAGHEHFVQPHKPANLRDAVSEIGRRSRSLVAHADHSHGDEREQLIQLADIVNWIPELAADSDLSEEDWNQAASVSRRMARSLSTLVQSDKPDFHRLEDEILPLKARLTPLVSRAGVPETQIEHGHGHSEHNDDEDISEGER